METWALLKKVAAGSGVVHQNGMVFILRVEAIHLMLVFNCCFTDNNYYV